MRGTTGERRVTRDVALTVDEYYAARAATPTPALPAEASPTVETRLYTALTDEEFGVSFDPTSALFALRFRSNTALLNLCQARDLSVVLTGTLAGWRADVHLPHRNRRKTQAR